LVYGVYLFKQYGFGPGLADYEYKIANSCTLNSSSAHMVSISCDGVERGIDPKIIKVGWNDNYLIAQTHPVTKRKYPNNPSNTYSEPDTSITYWWIVDFANKELIGPLSSEEELILHKPDAKNISFPLWSVDEAKTHGTWIWGDFRNIEADTENKIAYSRQFYNGNVRDFNTTLATFPGNVIGGMFKFTPQTFFEAEDSERKPVKVSF
jgi:hypothetical protein